MFVNNFLGNEINFFLFNSLLKEANIQLYMECARSVMSGGVVVRLMEKKSLRMPSGKKKCGQVLGFFLLWQ